MTTEIEDGGTAPRPPTSHETASHETWINEVQLPLQRIYLNERDYASRIFLTQPAHGALREWDWSAAVGEARRIAAHLRAQGWPPGSRIAILSKNCAWWILADFAIWMAGYTSVPIFPSLSETAVAAILDHSRPVACFLGALDHAPRVPNTSMHRIALPGAAPAAGGDSPGTGPVAWEEILRQREPLSGNPVRDPLDIATLIYTSGTMGEPKGVMQTFRSLALMAESMKPVLAGGVLDRILSYLPLAHIAERSIVEVNCLYLPFHIFFTEGQETFLDDLKRAHPTVFFTVPRLLVRFEQGVHERISERKLSLLLRLPIAGRLMRARILKSLALDQVRIAASGSAPLPAAVLTWYRRLGLNLIEGYGMTETGITHVTLPGKLRAGYVGNASPYADTRISEDGEIQIKGAMNLAGYYRNPALTQASFTGDGYFRTGDRGEIDAEGRLRIIGRLKEEFKTSKGKYVTPAPIENELNLSGLFEAVCVLGSGMAGPFAAAVLTAKKRDLSHTPETRIVLEEELERELQRVNQKLERHEQLRFVVVVCRPWTIENGFLTPALKVRRTSVEEEFAPYFETWEAAGKPVLWLEA